MVISQLQHRPSTAYFLFEVLKGEHWCRYSPGSQKAFEEHYPGPWSGQMDCVRQWLANLRRETDAVDLWAGLSGNEVLLGSSVTDQAGNEPFTVAERKHVATSLSEIRAYLISTQQINEESLRDIDARLQYLQDASDRLGKKDWLNVVFAVVANIVVGAALAPDAARNLLRLAGSALAWVLRGSPILPL